MFTKKKILNNMDDNHLLVNFKLPITRFHVTMLGKVEVAAVHVSILGRFFVQLFSRWSVTNFRISTSIFHPSAI